jgi:hypothetical protein
MDGTLCDLYGVEDWLSKLRASDPSPYRDAEPLLFLSSFARKLNALRRKGFHIGIISWLSKNSTAEYDEMVTAAKMEWLRTHLRSVEWDEIFILPYGTPKSSVVTDADAILFDDEKQNRDEWKGLALGVEGIMEILREF